MLRRHSPTGHAAYHDLKQALLDEAAGEVRGTPTPVRRDGKTYWYDTYRVGAQVRKRYIGPESPALLERLARHAALKADAKAREADRARLMRLLRAEGYPAMDGATGSLMAALGSAGVFRLGGTIVGTHAFRLYEAELGVRLAFDQTAMTNDIDIASFEHLSLALEDAAAPPVTAVLSDFAFDPVASLAPGKTWRWRQSRSNLYVEFLTPSFREEEELRPLAALGVSAQSLHFLNYLIAEPIEAVALYRHGVLTQIPRPERFAVHKLIVAARRQGSDALKAQKDRAQAALLIEALSEDRPGDLAEAYAAARWQGPKWVGLIDNSLKRMPDTRARLEAAG